MTDREYLRSLGFTVGERGRFSKEMVDALAKRDTDKALDHMNEINQLVGLPVPQEPAREAQILYGQTVSGHKVAFVMCSSCAHHMMWCECPDGVTAPDNVAVLTGAAKGIAKLHPRMVLLTTTV